MKRKRMHLVQILRIQTTNLNFIMMRTMDIFWVGTKCTKPAATPINTTIHLNPSFLKLHRA